MTTATFDQTAAPLRPALPWWGSVTSIRQAAIGLAGGATIATIYTLAASRWFDTPTSTLEWWALLTSLACVWLSRTENVWSMPTGIVSCVLMGWFFLQIDLVGQGWLQLGFYIPVQVVGWWAWCRGGAGGGELEVHHTTARVRLAALAAGIVAWAAVWALFAQLYGQTPYQGWDASVVAASVVAQLLMTAKRTDCWLWWQFPVNVSAIGLYAATGSWAFTFLYIVYLVNAVSGWRMWMRSANRTARHA